MLLFAVFNWLICFPQWVLNDESSVEYVFGMGTGKGVELDVRGCVVIKRGIENLDMQALDCMFIHIKLLLEFLEITKVQLPGDPVH